MLKRLLGLIWSLVKLPFQLVMLPFKIVSFITSVVVYGLVLALIGASVYFLVL